MGYLEQSVEIYERLRRKTFQITIENEMVFLLRFLPEYYHHLAGFQHLRDFSDLAQPGNGARGFYRNVKKAGFRKKSSIRAKRKLERLRKLWTRPRVPSEP